MSFGPPPGDPNNPYAPTSDTSFAGPSIANSDAEAYRNKYLAHEASCQSVGLLYGLGGIFMVIAGVFGLVASIAGAAAGGQQDVASAAVVGVFSLVYLGFGVFNLFVARGLRRLDSWSRIATIVLSAIGLLGFPIGTIISGYILYLMASEKGQVVFSSAYREIIDQTPHIKYKTSPLVVGCLVILVILIIVGVVAAVFGSRIN